MGFPILVRCHLYIESGPWLYMSGINIQQWKCLHVDWMVISGTLEVYLIDNLQCCYWWLNTQHNDFSISKFKFDINWLMQEWLDSIVDTLELCLSCINPSISFQPLSEIHQVAMWMYLINKECCYKFYIISLQCSTWMPILKRFGQIKRTILIWQRIFHMSKAWFYPSGTGRWVVM